jgi:hypothetical protein
MDEQFQKLQDEAELPEEHIEIIDVRLNEISLGNAQFKTWEEVYKKYKS